MEPLFTNACAYSRENLQEAMFALNKRKKILFSLIGLVLIASSVNDYFFYHDYLFLLMAFALLALILYKYVYQIITKAKLLASRCFVIYHEVPVQTVRFFEDHVEPVSIMSLTTPN